MKRSRIKLTTDLVVRPLPNCHAETVSYFETQLEELACLMSSPQPMRNRKCKGFTLTDNNKG
jgi:hypothetical protein